MIQCHALVLLQPELRQSDAAKALLRIDGLVAPAFLFAAGFALALLQVRSAAQGLRQQRLGRNLKRIAEVLAVATLVNWMWFPLLREPRWLARMDILHCVGLCLLLVLPATAGLARRPRVLRGVALVLGLAVFAVSPLGEDVTGAWAYLLNKSTGAVFPLLPWLGYTWLGAYAGAVAGEAGRRGLVRALLALVALGAVGWACSEPLRALYPPHRFSVTNPAEAALRWTWVCLVLLALLALEAQLGAQRARSPVRRFVEVFGTSSLSAYFLHEALLYYRTFGLSFERFWRDRSGWAQYAALTLALILLTFALCTVLDRVQEGWRSVRTRLAQRGVPALRPGQP
ncbi:DUF1624 domain-containing protein [Aggregicoccus sp. 17bor-14]|nr:DUF1624 domain-containing protein [Simulacricoccus sp. 17bor-14]MRI86566.1 DUF1624 domain-containing protein [Aggregicoccus sp. 17bor-14]